MNEIIDKTSYQKYSLMKTLDYGVKLHASEILESLHRIMAIELTAAVLKERDLIDLTLTFDCYYKPAYNRPTAEPMEPVKLMRGFPTLEDWNSYGVGWDLVILMEVVAHPQTKY